MVLAIAEGQACALSQQVSPPGRGLLRLGGRRGVLFGGEPRAVRGPWHRPCGLGDAETVGGVGPPRRIRDGHPRSRTMPDPGERRAALLESVLASAVIRETPRRSTRRCRSPPAAPYTRRGRISASTFPQVRDTYSNPLRSR